MERGGGREGGGTHTHVEKIKTIFFLVKQVVVGTVVVVEVFGNRARRSAVFVNVRKSFRVLFSTATSREGSAFFFLRGGEGGWLRRLLVRRTRNNKKNPAAIFV